jgi:hypothetical protein
MASSGTVVVNMATLEAAHDLKKKKSVQIGKLYRFPLVQPECMGEQSYFSKEPISSVWLTRMGLWIHLSWLGSLRLGPERQLLNNMT